MAQLEPSSLSLDYRHTQAIVDTDDVAQSWTYEVTSSSDASVRLGHGRAVLVDLFGADPYGSLDPFDAHVHRLRAAAMDPVSRELSTSWGGELEMFGDRLLLLNGMQLDPTVIESGLGPLVTAAAVAKLGHGVVAALYAPRRGGTPDPAGDVRSLRRAGLDFRPLGDGVHYLDPAGLDVAATLCRHVDRRPKLCSADRMVVGLR